MITEVSTRETRLNELFTFDMDSLFSNAHLSDSALTAAVSTSAKFDPSFPGWELYRRIIAGVGLFDLKLEAWAIGVAHQLARAKKVNGRHLISGATASKPGWIDQAARDALDHVIFGQYPVGLKSREKQFGVDKWTYARIRNTMAECMLCGLHTFRAVLHAEYFFVGRGEKPHPPYYGEIVGVRESHPAGGMSGSSYGHYKVIPAVESDNL